MFYALVWVMIMRLYTIARLHWSVCLRFALYMYQLNLNKVLLREGYCPASAFLFDNIDVMLFFYVSSEAKFKFSIWQHLIHVKLLGHVPFYERKLSRKLKLPLSVPSLKKKEVNQFCGKVSCNCFFSFGRVSYWSSSHVALTKFFPTYLIFLQSS